MLQLTHGFWVLLATLTVLRTSAADTRTALRPAVLGTIVGAVVSGGVMLVVDQPIVYAVVLPVTLMLAFGVGRLLGPLWQQALFTVLLTVVFAQLSPAGWRLAEARLVDVLLGAVIGVLAGVAMWPRARVTTCGTTPPATWRPTRRRSNRPSRRWSAMLHHPRVLSTGSGVG
ncbi:FUSC family protein [Micromonospora sp. M12]